jgi:hypothetical protein
MTDIDFIETLATLRILEMTQAIAAIHRGNKKACYDFWKKHEKLGNIEYYHHKREESALKGARFCALHQNAVKRFGVKEDRVWPLAEGCIDVHLATSAFVMDSIVSRNKNHYAVRAEPIELNKIYGTSLTPTVPWVIKPHIGRKAVVFRVHVGDEVSEVTRTLQTMRENARVSELMNSGEFGLLVLVSLKKYREAMQTSVKPLASDTRIFVGVGPTAHTLSLYLEEK